MKITIIGSGNIATHLAIALKKRGITIFEIYSRNYSNALALAQSVGSYAIRYIEKLSPDADIYLIAVSDKAISEVVEQMPLVSGVVAHTAGCVPISILEKFSSNGAFYPLQTFTKGIELDFAKIWIFIEGNNKNSTDKLKFLSSKLSNYVETICSEKRAILHLSATISCNFVNHLYFVSQQIVEKAGLSFEYLKPVIEETAQKACKISPSLAQTGPAKRKDKDILKLHMKILEYDDNFSEIYKKLSDSIGSR
ncbi:MAG: DUF2520 domain-containing protein [Marinilabiliaceae bacterium]|nr:DUF2520 domain-containing protein [Marinilabiliaceae bacterium]